jgi:predicted transcriptional regulator
MRLLWLHGQMIRREIQGALASDGKIVVSGTVQKCLARLESKGYVVHDRRKMTHFFKPAMALETYVMELLRVLLIDETGDKLANFLKRLLKSHKKSDY